MNYGPFSLDQAYSYYRNGLKKSYTGPDDAAYTYSYDPANRLAGVEIPGQGLVTFNSYQWNRPSKITLPGGATKAYSYDGLMRLTGIAMKDPAGAGIMDYRYSHDPSGNITGNQTEHGDYAYGYDALSRLTTVDLTGTEFNSVPHDEAYTYDSVGNRLTAAGVVEQWVYNGNNELESNGAAVFAYDVNGNTVSRAVGGVVANKYGYDTDNRLVEVKDGADGVVATYGYDPFGRRLWKEVGGVRIWFLYSDEGLVGEFDDSGAEVKSYGWLPGGTWGTDPLFMAEGDQFYWYLNDHLGTPKKLIDSTGREVWSAEYGAFGEAAVEVETVVNNLRFPGQYWDAETGLYYNWNRNYDPGTGAYTSIDPIGFWGGDVNLYRYVQNSPVNFIDPTGLYWFRQDWQAPGVVGRQGTPVPPRGLVSEVIEQYVPASYTFGEMHDSFVDIATSAGLPDWLVNIPSMSSVYQMALTVEMLRTLGILEQPFSPEQSAPCGGRGASGSW